MFFNDLDRYKTLKEDLFGFSQWNKILKIHKTSKAFILYYRYIKTWL